MKRSCVPIRFGGSIGTEQKAKAFPGSGESLRKTAKIPLIPAAGLKDFTGKETTVITDGVRWSLKPLCRQYDKTAQALAAPK